VTFMPFLSATTTTNNIDESMAKGLMRGGDGGAV
jgi:hypothetical protein